VTWEVGACSVTTDVLMQWVESLLKKIGVGDETDPMPQQAVLLIYQLQYDTVVN
jgi:hypothetical protein